jgi:anti-sigma regulatory factor (Ser/Thr protein kinase)
VPAILSLRPAAGDVRVAREFCARELSRVVGGADQLIDDAAMITSELVTNSIRAGAQSIELLVDCTEDAFRIAVVDDADGEVVAGTPDALAPSGRGLRIIESLAARWGVDSHGTSKAVWADLSLPTTRDRLLDAQAS